MNDALKRRAKNAIKRYAQRMFGFHNYLVARGILTAATLRFRRGENLVFELLRRLPQDATVVDIGANVGALTILFARRARNGRVYAIEPMPESQAAIAHSARLLRLNNIEVLPHALGEQDGQVEMVMPVNANVPQDGLSYVVGSHHASLAGRSYHIQMRRLDGLGELRDRRVDAIKLDTDGYERFVLRGARELLVRDRPIVYAEIWAEENRAECFEVLKESGYDLAASSGVRFLFTPNGRSSAADLSEARSKPSGYS